uniref:Uncharacterized protein n=1 Tax=Pseudomonas syringae pv. actinidiae TaxID=103796 RepID=A0A286JZT6_PSESF|nr:hypothetical protein [Pseudomonas syringae pv. actinidiae]
MQSQADNTDQNGDAVSLARAFAFLPPLPETLARRTDELSIPDIGWWPMRETARETSRI